LENCVIVGIDMDVVENDRAGDAGHNRDHWNPGEEMRLIKLVQVTLALVILGFPFAPLVVVEAIAGPYEDAEAAYDAQNYAKALKDLNPLVHAGNDKAQYLLGRMYALGRGVTQNYEEALKLYRLAGAQGNGDAQNSIGNLYAMGKGVTRDDNEALKWYRLSAARGNAHGEHGLGNMYASGTGVGKDIVRAYMWYSLAAEQGNTTSVTSRDYRAAEMTAAQIAQAKAMAAKCKASNYKDCG
jgi:TPR repeat protein